MSGSDKSLGMVLGKSSFPSCHLISPTLRSEHALSIGFVQCHQCSFMLRSLNKPLLYIYEVQVFSKPFDNSTWDPYTVNFKKNLFNIHLSEVKAVPSVLQLHLSSHFGKQSFPWFCLFLLLRVKSVLTKQQLSR